MIERTIRSTIEKKIGRGKAIMVVGPRQVGKTTLIKSQLAGDDFKFLTVMILPYGHN